MSKEVLVAVPVGKSHLGWLSSIVRQYNRLTYTSKEIAIYPNTYDRPQTGNRYKPNARSRNELIDCYLKTTHKYVLWLDVDLLDIPDDIIERLFAVSREDVVAPYVFRQHSNGRFYDIGGFNTLDGKWFNMFPPYFDGDDGGDSVIELGSVGCCYIVPAWVYFKGARYRPNSNEMEVEHVSFMRQVRDLGLKVWADRSLVISHENPNL